MVTGVGPPGDDRWAQSELSVELSGFHAVKHALRFEAPDLLAWTDDRDRVLALCDRLAPDLTRRLGARLTDVDGDAMAGLGGFRHPTHVLGRASRAGYVVGMLDEGSDRPMIHLDHPVDPGNVGAVVRVAAAVGAAGVTTSGFTQLWAPACLRGSAGLHYALPVLEVAAGDPSGLGRDRPVVAFDPGGDPFDPAALDPASTLVFGAERDGVSAALLGRADTVARLPMTEGVSSLNLATAVSAAVYSLTLVDAHR